MVTVIPSIWPAVAWVPVVLRMELMTSPSPPPTAATRVPSVTMRRRISWRELPAARRTPISLIRLRTETSVVLASPDRAMTRVAPRTRQTIQGQPCDDG